MRDKRTILLLTAAGLLAAASLAAWVAGCFVTAPSLHWGVVHRLTGAGFLLAGWAVGLWVFYQIRSAQQARQCFEQMSRMQSPQLSRLASGADPLPLAPDHPWFEPAQHIIGRLATNCEQVIAAEQARSALEVRIRRAAVRQEQLEAILGGLADPVLAVNAFDELTLVNPAAAKLFQLDEKAALGQPLAQALTYQPLVDLIVDTRRRKAPAQRHGEIEIVDDQNNTRWFAVHCRSLIADERQGASSANAGKSPGAYVVLRDVAEIKAGQRRYADFISSVSHEMKSPLAGIKAYVELLADGEAEEPQVREEFLNVINSQANRLQRLIDNLLNLARIEAGVMHVSKNSVSLNELLSETLDIVRPAATARRITLTSEISPLYLGVLADRDMLVQVAINLLSNAIKYTPEGGRVTLRSRSAGAQVQFEVEDTGVGLAPEDQVKVFEKFYRVKKDRNMASGTGLGLPLAKHIVEDVHSGRLTVRSTPGAGSVFLVSLPTTKAARDERCGTSPERNNLPNLAVEPAASINSSSPAIGL
jgi:two-component system phosphate regulon sensor histidine kinase PhoR